MQGILSGITSCSIIMVDYKEENQEREDGVKYHHRRRWLEMNTPGRCAITIRAYSKSLCCGDCLA